MDAISTLRQEKMELLEKISTAAREGMSEVILSASDKLRKVEILISRYEQLEVEIVALKRDEGLHVNKGEIIGSVMKPMSTISPCTSFKTVRENGREIRKVFLEKLLQLDIHLQLVKGETIFRTKSGEKVGIAVATERQPDRWFLGLPEGAFDHAVLLCQRGSGDVVEIRLPKGFFSKYGSALSESKGQVKFNISRKGNGYAVKVPGIGGVNPADFSSDYSFLK